MLHHPDFCKPRADAHKPQDFNFCLEHPLCSDTLPLSHAVPRHGEALSSSLHLTVQMHIHQLPVGRMRVRAAAEIQLRAHEWFEFPQGFSLPSGRDYFQPNTPSIDQAPVLVAQLLKLVFYTKKLVKSQR